MTLPTNKTHPYLYTDVVYDVHGKSLISLYFFNTCYFRSDNTGNVVASISKWWTLPFRESNKSNKCVACFECICTPVMDQRLEPNAYVIDIVNGGRLDAKQKSALIGAALLIEFTYYLPEREAEDE